MVSGALGLGDQSCRMDAYRGRKCLPRNRENLGGVEDSSGVLRMCRGEWDGMVSMCSEERRKPDHAWRVMEKI